MNIKVSIVIPVYKVEDYIEKCIYSVIGQTYSGSLECLLIDDCSPDKSIEIVKSIISNYKGKIEFRIITHDNNRGLSAARNTGIKKATGDYVYFLDSDDYIIPECIELMVGMILKYPTVEMVQSGANSNDSFLGIENKNIESDYSENKEWIKKTMLKRFIVPITSWNKLINRRFLINNNLFFKEGIIHEDELFNFYLAKHLSKIAFCKKNTYVYIKREGSIMSSNKNKSEESWLIIYNEFINNIDAFCKQEQVNSIYTQMLFKFLYQQRKDKETYKKLYLSLSKECSVIGKIIIYLTLYTPYTIIKRKPAYNFFSKTLSKCLLV